MVNRVDTRVLRTSSPPLYQPNNLFLLMKLEFSNIRSHTCSHAQRFIAL